MESSISQKSVQVFSDPFTAVDIQPVQVAGENIATKLAVRVKADDGTWSRTPTVVSSGYNLIQNTLVKDVGDDIMSRSGHQWAALKQHWDGKRFISMWITNNPIAQVDGAQTHSARSHPIHLGLMLRNAYDGSGVFGVEIFACNVACTNQYHDRNRFGYFAVRHIGQNTFDIDDALANLSTGAQNVIGIAPRLNQLRSTPLEVKHIMDARKNTQIPSSKWADVLDQLSKEEDGGVLYGLYQALTFVATHEVGGLNSISVGESVSKHLLAA